MQATNTGQSWGWVARVLHWTMAALILFQLGLGVWMMNFEPDLLAQFTLIQTHKSWGFVIFCLALVRVAWRAVNPAPALPDGTPRWQVRAAAASHVGLYVLILLMPVSGWVMAAASPTQDLLNMQNMVFGSFALPDPWVPGRAGLEAAARAVHVASAVLLALLLGLHVAAALKQHLGGRDAVLRRMTVGG
jgi:cytochrome b561